MNERIKQCLLFVLLFAVFLTASYTVSSDEAYAATPHPYDTYCSSSIQPPMTGWLSFMSQTGYYRQSGGVYVVDPKPAGLLANGYFTMGSNSSTNWVIASTKPIKFLKHTNGNYYANFSVDSSFNPVKDLRTVPSSYNSSTTISSLKGSQPPSSQQGYQPWAWTGSGTGTMITGTPASPTTNNLNWTSGVSVGQGSQWWYPIGQTTGTSSRSNPCKKFGNVTYDASWDTTTATTTTVDNKTYPTTEGCKMTDIGCLLQNAFATVENTFIAVGEAIVNGFALLFSPDQSTLAYSFDELKTFMFDKLGFLTYPIEWALDLYEFTIGQLTNDINWSYTVCNGNGPVFELGGISGSNFMGGDVNIDPCAIPDVIMTPLRILAQIGISLMLVYAFRHKIHEVMEK